MIRQIAWNTFKNTGNIDTFLELMQVEDAERDLDKSEFIMGEIDGDIKNKRDNITRT